MAEGPNYTTDDQTKLPYLPPYHNQYIQFNNDAYAYNRATPSHSSTNLASGARPLPLYHSWNQDANISLFPNSQIDTMYNTHQVFDHQNNAQFYQHATLLTHPSSASVSKLANGADFKSADINNPACNSMMLAHHSNPLYRGTDAIKYFSTVQPSLYNGNQGYSAGYTLDSETNNDFNTVYPNQSQRQQSDSYSPCATPLPAPGELHPSGEVQPFSAANPENKTQEFHECQTGGLQKKSMSTASEAQQFTSQKINLEGKSVAESKMKAKSAILALWSYGVGYETYLQEGFKRDIVENLFKDMKMQNWAPVDPTSQINQNKLEPKSNAFSNHENSEVSSRSNDNEKLKSHVAPPTAVDKPSPMAEKQKTLQSKMEALKKSREATREAKAFAKKVAETRTGQVAENPAKIDQNTAPKNDKTSDSPNTLNSAPTSKLPVENHATLIPLPIAPAYNTSATTLTSNTFAENNVKLNLVSKAPVGNYVTSNFIPKTPAENISGSIFTANLPAENRAALKSHNENKTGSTLISNLPPKNDTTSSSSPKTLVINDIIPIHSSKSIPGNPTTPTPVSNISTGNHVAPTLASKTSIENHVTPTLTSKTPIENHISPILTSKAPIENHAAPILMSKAPTENHTAPIVKSKAPIENHAAPILMSKAPTENHTAPIVKSKAPIENHAAPTLTTKSPIENHVAHTLTSTAPIINHEISKLTSKLPSENLGTTSLTPKTHSENHATSIPVSSINNTVDSTIKTASELTRTSNNTPTTNELPLQTQSQIPAIPGLFLVSNSTNSTSKPSTNSPARQRKRPVASDFDETAVTTIPFKRPFGHNRCEQRVVIDVSDDESEDGDIPTEFGSQKDHSPVISSVKTSNTTQTSQSSSNSPAQKSFTSNTNAAGHTSTAATKPSLLAPSILKQKQREIQMMKDKIAAAEAQLKVKSTLGSVGTPQQSESGSCELREHQALNITSPKDPDTPTMTLSRSAIQDDMDDSKYYESGNTTSKNKKETGGEPNSKYIHQKKIDDKIPIIEAEVQFRKSRLAQLKSEMAEVEANLRKDLNKRQKIAEEMKRLDQESSDNLELDVTPKLLNETSNDLKCSKPNSNADSPKAFSIVQKNEIILDKQSIPKPAQSIRSASRESDRTSQDSPIKDFSQDPSIMDSLQDSPIKDSSQDTPENDILDSSKTLKSPMEKDSKIEETGNREIEKALQEAVRVDADCQGDASKSEYDNSYVSEPSHQASEVTDSSMEEGELSSDYTPELATMEGVEGESDNYEPPDATAPDQKSPVASPPFSPAPPELNGPTKSEQIQIINSNQSLDVNERGNIAELLPHENARIPQQLVEEFVTSNAPSGFTPYQSPLKIFRAYRFHPNYKNDVAGGLRSMTYSHKIDPQKEFCRFESAGGVCNDSGCDLQHFKTITLPDDGIMAALGCPDEFTGDRREKFVAGLREVLLDLRLRKVNDFDIIASEIVAHRAKFLGDQTKVLALEGTTI